MTMIATGWVGTSLHVNATPQLIHKRLSCVGTKSQSHAHAHGTRHHTPNQQIRALLHTCRFDAKDGTPPAIPSPVVEEAPPVASSNIRIPAPRSAGTINDDELVRVVL